MVAQLQRLGSKGDRYKETAIISLFARLGECRRKNSNDLCNDIGLCN